MGVILRYCSPEPPPHHEKEFYGNDDELVTNAANYWNPDSDYNATDGDADIFSSSTPNEIHYASPEFADASNDDYRVLAHDKGVKGWAGDPTDEDWWPEEVMFSLLGISREEPWG